MKKVPTIWAKFPNIQEYRICFLLQIYFLGGIIRALETTNKSIWIKIRPIEKLPTLLVNHENIVNKVPTIWIRFRTYPGLLDLLTSLVGIIRVLKPTNKHLVEN